MRATPPAPVLTPTPPPTTLARPIEARHAINLLSQPRLYILFRHFGALAQLVARFHGMEEVRGSNPLCSTTNPKSQLAPFCGPENQAKPTPKTTHFTRINPSSHSFSPESFRDSVPTHDRQQRPNPRPQLLVLMRDEKEVQMPKVGWAMIGGSATLVISPSFAVALISFWSHV